LGGRLTAERLRTKVIDDAYVRITEDTKYGRLPHLIAHSFGTYAVGMAVLQQPAFAFDTAIFSGCVLSTAFPWAEVDGRFQNVYNEVAGKDLVPLAASLIGWIVPQMGGAGRYGFVGPKGYVHSLSVADAFCRRCESPWPGCRRACATLSRCAAPIHNVHYKLFGHGSFAVGKQHARTRWLPLLWGLDPLLFNDFIQACLKCAQLENDEALPSEFIAAETDLRCGCWGWTNGSLEQFVVSQLKIRLNQLGDGRAPEKFIGLVIRGTYVAVSLAVDEAATSRDERLALALHPKTAVARAVQGVLPRKTGR
jgi:hypothetical protein